MSHARRITDIFRTTWTHVDPTFVFDVDSNEIDSFKSVGMSVIRRHTSHRACDVVVKLYDDSVHFDLNCTGECALRAQTSVYDEFETTRSAFPSYGSTRTVDHRTTRPQDSPDVRTFGIELEFVGIDRRTAAQALTDVGIDARNEHYNHSTVNYWKVVSDGSLSDSYGGEAVSPPLPWNDEGRAELEQVCSALRDAGATVNVSCGTHVHVGVRDLTRTQIVNTVYGYVARQSFMDQVVSNSRRNSTWASHWQEHTLRDVARRFCHSGGTGGNRYVTVNLNSYPRHGTIEFRQHQGTLNATKLIRWVELAMALVEEALTDPIEEFTPAAASTWENVLDAFADLNLTEVTRRWFYMRAAELA